MTFSDILNENENGEHPYVCTKLDSESDNDSIHDSEYDFENVMMMKYTKNYGLWYWWQWWVARKGLYGDNKYQMKGKKILKLVILTWIIQARLMTFALMGAKTLKSKVILLMVR